MMKATLGAIIAYGMEQMIKINPLPAIAIFIE
jgi:hypothetical protein